MAIYNIKTNTMTVIWSTAITDIINIAMIAKNTQSGKEHSVVVGPNERRVDVVADCAPYNITVVVFDICGMNYSSIVFVVDQHIKSFSAPFSGATLQSNASPLTTFEKTSYAETTTYHFSMYTSAHQLTFDTPQPSPHYSPENTEGNRNFLLNFIIKYLLPI